MSSIRIDLPSDKAAIILKRIQNKLSTYKGYKTGADARISSQVLGDDIEKRIDVSLTNFKAAIENLEMYDKLEEKEKAGEVYNKIENLRSKKVSVPAEPFLAKEEVIQKFYLLDEVGFRNSIDLLDNINSFRSASISGDFDATILQKISENIEKIASFVDEKNLSLKPQV
ncbi:MAG: hypothetical protein M0Z77_00790 [Thermoplasmatales archaeon]|jgi:uncharacterized radical SAM superfamily protein|nr:hypothetical protein [Candidatus Thermoplasmatota archaeon]MCL6003055.1 hypothetical protein [Candidatus Thermoplasmatota archaeon]MDA8054170.1 hypothetical protein [Thermoplasmatales archaeon]